MTDAIEDTLVQVTYTHHRGGVVCAAIVLANGVCVRAAPILRWCLGKDAATLSAEFKRRGWKATQRPCGPVVGEKLEKTNGDQEPG